MVKRMLMMATTAAMIEQFNKSNILILEDMGYEVHVLGNFHVGNPISDERLDMFKDWLSDHHGKWFHYSATRNPVDFKNNIKAYKYVLNLIKKYHYQFIHCHTPIGSVIGRLAAKRTGTKVIYTAHGFHFFKGAPLKNWLLYYPVESFLSRWTDTLVLINHGDYHQAKKNFYAKKIKYIPGVGIDYEKFFLCQIDIKKKRCELGLEDNDFVILSVGELNDNKNHSVIIKAMAEIKDTDIKYIICGKGKGEETLIKLISKLHLEKQVFLLGFRDDVADLLHISDLFAFPSRREGLGLAALEAMAAGLPIITSNINGINDYSQNGITGYKYAPNDYKGFSEGIKLLKNDIEKRHLFAENNRFIAKRYDIKNIQKSMKKIYKSIEQ